MARLEISKSAIWSNLNTIARQLSVQTQGGTRIIAILKDNAYGHGSALVGRFLKDSGINFAAVKNEAEAAEISTIFEDILLLSQPAALAKNSPKFIYAINDLRDFAALKGARVMLKIDSGMSRSGLRCGQISEAVAAAKAAGCTLLGAFSHYASVAQMPMQQVNYARALQEYLEAARRQNMLSAQADELAARAEFQAASAQFRQSASAAALPNSANEAKKSAHEAKKSAQPPGGEMAVTGNFSSCSKSSLAAEAPGCGAAVRGNFSAKAPGGEMAVTGNFSSVATTTAATTVAESAQIIRECAASGGAFFHSAASFGLFAGGCADGAARVGLALYGYASELLRPSSRLFAHRISTRHLRAGDAVGYDGKFIAQTPMTSSNYDLGYADGLAFYDGSWPLELDGAQVLGKFSMDSFSAASDAPEICIYEDAAVYAAKFGISVYEALVRLSPKIPRIWVD